MNLNVISRISIWFSIWFMSFISIVLGYILVQLAVEYPIDMKGILIIAFSAATILTLVLQLRSFMKKARLIISPNDILIKNHLFHAQRILKQDIKYIGNIGETIAVFNHHDELIGQSFVYPNQTIERLIHHDYYQADQVNPYLNQFETFKKPWPDLHPKVLKILKRAYRKNSSDFLQFRKINKRMGKYGVLAKLDGNMQIQFLRVKLK